MSRQIYVNLPIRNMEGTKAFFSALGFSFNPQFTNEQGACMVIGDNIHAMLLEREFFKTFTHKQIADTRSHTETLICISCDSKAEVDNLVKTALAGGGTAPRPAQDHGFMYYHGFEDLDGHTWELAYMSGMPPAQ